MPVALRPLLAFLSKALVHTEDESSKCDLQASTIDEHEGIFDTYGNLKAVIGQDEGGVRAGELGGRHVDGWC
jgi:hypothetical protein